MATDKPQEPGCFPPAVGRTGLMWASMMRGHSLWQIYRGPQAPRGELNQNDTQMSGGQWSGTKTVSGRRGIGLRQAKGQAWAQRCTRGCQTVTQTHEHYL